MLTALDVRGILEKSPFMYNSFITYPLLGGRSMNQNRRNGYYCNHNVADTKLTTVLLSLEWLLPVC